MIFYIFYLHHSSYFRQDSNFRPYDSLTHLLPLQCKYSGTHTPNIQSGMSKRNQTLCLVLKKWVICNIIHLLQETQQKTVDFVLNGFPYRVETGGVITTIIDFSLSRLTTLEGTSYKNSVIYRLLLPFSVFKYCGLALAGVWSEFDTVFRWNNISISVFG